MQGAPLALFDEEQDQRSPRSNGKIVLRIIQSDHILELLEGQEMGLQDIPIGIALLVWYPFLALALIKCRHRANSSFQWLISVKLEYIDFFLIPNRTVKCNYNINLNP